MRYFLIFLWLGMGACSTGHAALILEMSDGALIQCKEGRQDKENLGHRVTWYPCSGRGVRVLLKQVETSDSVEDELSIYWDGYELREKGSSVDLANIVKISDGDRVVLVQRPFEPSKTLFEYQSRLKGTMENVQDPPDASGEDLKLRYDLWRRASKIEGALSTAIRDHSALDVQLSDGQTVTCDRGGKAGCFFYHCPNVKMGDTLGSGIFLYDEFSSRMVLGSKGQMGPSITVLGASLKSDSPRFPGGILFSKEMGKGDIDSKKPHINNLSADQKKWSDFAKIWSNFTFIRDSWDKNGQMNCALQPFQSLLTEIAEPIVALEREYSKFNFIKVVSYQKGFLESAYVEKLRMPGNVLPLSEDTYLLKEGDYEVFLSKFWGQDTNIYSEAEAQQIFELAAKMKEIPFQFMDDGCASRAHEICDRLKLQEKVWIIPPAGRKLVPVANPSLNWDFHVAPTLRVRNEGDKIVRMVIDPSLSSTLLTIEEWAARVSQPGPLPFVSWPFPSNPEVVGDGNRAGARIHSTPDWLYLPLPRKFVDRRKPDWFIQALILGDIKHKRDNLEHARKTNRSFLKAWLDKVGAKEPVLVAPDSSLPL